MVRFWIRKKNLGFLQLTGAFVAVSFLFSTVSAPFAQANFWQERRNAAQELKKEQSSGALQSPETLLAQLPSVGQNILPTFEKGTVPFRGLSPFPDRTQTPKLISGLEWITTLPLNYATFKKASIPATWKPKDPIVIYIQDAHLNKDAQTNIGKSIQHFIDHGNLDLVALEGAFDPIDLSHFRSFPHPEAVHKVADYLLRENKISGAIHTAFTSPKAIPSYIGVDDKAHYDANVEAYKKSFPQVSLYKEKLEQLKKELQSEKARTFNPQLLEFDTKIQQYQQGKEKLGAYIQILSDRHSGESRNPETRIFLKALEFESTLDFPQVEKERSLLLKKLVQNLSKAQMQQVLNASLAYRLGNIKNKDFYVYIKDLCQKNGVSFKTVPTMEKYLQYVILADSIDAEKLFDEVKEMEENVYSSLSKSTQEKDLVKQSKYFYLLGKLLNSSLTREEWKEYEVFSVRHPRPVRHSGESRNPEKTGSWLDSGLRRNDDQNIDLSSFENFYKESLIRDEKISANLLTAIKEKSAKATVLVTGGFHADGIEQILHKANVAVITYTPKITKVDTENGSAYLSVFTQEKTPLQKLFDGEKLFLPPKVLSNSTQLMAAANVVNVLEAEDPNSDVPASIDNQRFHDLSRALINISKHFKVTAADVSDGIADVTIKNKNGTVKSRLELSQDKGKPIASIQDIKTYLIRPILQYFARKSVLVTAISWSILIAAPIFATVGVLYPSAGWALTIPYASQSVSVQSTSRITGGLTSSPVTSTGRITGGLADSPVTSTGRLTGGTPKSKPDKFANPFRYQFILYPKSLSGRNSAEYRTGIEIFDRVKRTSIPIAEIPGTKRDEVSSLVKDRSFFIFDSNKAGQSSIFFVNRANGVNRSVGETLGRWDFAYKDMKYILGDRFAVMLEADSSRSKLFLLSGEDGSIIKEIPIAIKDATSISLEENSLLIHGQNGPIKYKIEEDGNLTPTAPSPTSNSPWSWLYGLGLGSLRRVGLTPINRTDKNGAESLIKKLNYSKQHGNSVEIQWTNSSGIHSKTGKITGLIGYTPRLQAVSIQMDGQHLCLVGEVDLVLFHRTLWDKIVMNREPKEQIELHELPNDYRNFHHNFLDQLKQHYKEEGYGEAQIEDLVKKYYYEMIYRDSTDHKMLRIYKNSDWDVYIRNSSWWLVSRLLLTRVIQLTNLPDSRWKHTLSHLLKNIHNPKYLIKNLNKNSTWVLDKPGDFDKNTLRVMVVTSVDLYILRIQSILAAIKGNPELVKAEISTLKDDLEIRHAYYRSRKEFLESYIRKFGITAVDQLIQEFEKESISQGPVKNPLKEDIPSIITSALGAIALFLSVAGALLFTHPVLAATEQAVQAASNIKLSYFTRIVPYNPKPKVPLLFRNWPSKVRAVPGRDPRALKGSPYYISTVYINGGPTLTNITGIVNKDPELNGSGDRLFMLSNNGFPQPLTGIPEQTYLWLYNLKTGEPILNLSKNPYSTKEEKVKDIRIQWPSTVKKTIWNATALPYRDSKISADGNDAIILRSGEETSKLELLRLEDGIIVKELPLPYKNISSIDHIEDKVLYQLLESEPAKDSTPSVPLGGLGLFAAAFAAVRGGASPWPMNSMDPDLKALLEEVLKARKQNRENRLEELAAELLKIGPEKFGSLTEFLSHLSQLNLSGPDQARVIVKLIVDSLSNKYLRRKVISFLAELVEKNKSGLPSKDEKVSPLFLAIVESILENEERKIQELNELVSNALGLFDELAPPGSGIAVPDALMAEVDNYLRRPQPQNSSRRHDPKEFIPWLKAQGVTNPSLIPWLESVGIRSDPKFNDLVKIDPTLVREYLSNIPKQIVASLRSEAWNSILDALEDYEWISSWQDKVIVLDSLDKDYQFLVSLFSARGAKVIASDSSQPNIENFYDAYPGYKKKIRYKDILLVLPAKDYHYLANGKLFNSRRVRRMGLKQTGEGMVALPRALFESIDEEIFRFKDSASQTDRGRIEMKKWIHARLYNKTMEFLKREEFKDASNEKTSLSTAQIIQLRLKGVVPLIVATLSSLLFSSAALANDGKTNSAWTDLLIQNWPVALVAAVAIGSAVVALLWRFSIKARWVRSKVFNKINKFSPKEKDQFVNLLLSIQFIREVINNPSKGLKDGDPIPVQDIIARSAEIALKSKRAGVLGVTDKDLHKIYKELTGQDLDSILASEGLLDYTLKQRQWVPSTGSLKGKPVKSDTEISVQPHKNPLNIQGRLAGMVNLNVTPQEIAEFALNVYSEEQTSLPKGKFNFELEYILQSIPQQVLAQIPNLINHGVGTSRVIRFLERFVFERKFEKKVVMSLKTVARIPDSLLAGGQENFRRDSASFSKSKKTITPRASADPRHRSERGATIESIALGVLLFLVGVSASYKQENPSLKSSSLVLEHIKKPEQIKPSLPPPSNFPLSPWSWLFGFGAAFAGLSSKKREKINPLDKPFGELIIIPQDTSEAENSTLDEYIAKNKLNVVHLIAFDELQQTPKELIEILSWIGLGRNYSADPVFTHLSESKIYQALKEGKTVVVQLGNQTRINISKNLFSTVEGIKHGVLPARTPISVRFKPNGDSVQDIQFFRSTEDIVRDSQEWKEDFSMVASFKQYLIEKKIRYSIIKGRPGFVRRAYDYFPKELVTEDKLWEAVEAFKAVVASTEDDKVWDQALGDFEETYRMFAEVATTAAIYPALEGLQALMIEKGYLLQREPASYDDYRWLTLLKIHGQQAVETNQGPVAVYFISPVTERKDWEPKKLGWTTYEYNYVLVNIEAIHNYYKEGAAPHLSSKGPLGIDSNLAGFSPHFYQYLYKLGFEGIADKNDQILKLIANVMVHEVEHKRLHKELGLNEKTFFYMRDKEDNFPLEEVLVRLHTLAEGDPYLELVYEHRGLVGQDKSSWALFDRLLYTDNLRPRALLEVLRRVDKLPSMVAGVEDWRKISQWEDTDISNAQLAEIIDHYRIVYENAMGILEFSVTNLDKVKVRDLMITILAKLEHSSLENIVDALNTLLTGTKDQLKEAARLAYKGAKEEWNKLHADRLRQLSSVLGFLILTGTLAWALPAVAAGKEVLQVGGIALGFNLDSAFALGGIGILAGGLISRFFARHSSSLSNEEKLADVVGDAMVSIYYQKMGTVPLGTVPIFSHAVEGILKGTDLKQDIQSVSGIRGQENLLLQTFNQLDQEKFALALQEKLKKSFNGKLSNEEANWLATQVVTSGFKMELFDVVFGEQERGKTPVIKYVMEPSKSPVKQVTALLNKYEKLKKEGEQPTFLLVGIKDLSPKQQAQIRMKAQLLNGSVTFITDENLFQKVGNRFYNLDLAALDTRLSNWISSEHSQQRDFSSKYLILPKSLVGDLTAFAKLPLDSLVRQAILVDAFFRAALPIQRYYQTLEEIQKVIHLITEQA